ncbi:MAG: cyclophilin family peptidyl-prolyl cis-trans isomerase [Pseudoalteromonas tetraodonis]|jgi:cyclophilin family peptidyl-prolyl cis-trans isomerase
MKARICNTTSALVLCCFATAALAAPPAAPTGFAFAASTARDLGTLEWIDNATDEVDFELEFKFGDNGFQVAGFRPAENATSVTFNGFAPDTPATFRLRAENADGFSDYSEEATVETKNFQIVASCVTVTPGGSFSKQFSLNDSGSIQLESTLPDWISWDAVNFVLSGTDAPAGIVLINFSAQTGVHSRTRNFYVQVINEAPVVTAAPTVTELDDVAVEVELGNHFNDPDMGRAATMSTPAGPIQVGLYDDPINGAPITVDNFFAYAEAGRWDGTFFHRSVEQFVIQGGGYKPEPGAVEGQFVDVEEFDSIINEYDVGRPNICGTVSMAKLGGSPDSATSEFFVSLKDNISILDGQNGGFTVFGRVIDMAAADQISAFDTATYTANFGAAGRSFSDWPLSAATEDSPLVSQLASITGVIEVPTLSFAVSGGDAAVATASLDGSTLTFIPVNPGQTEFIVTATDLDGGEVTQSFVVQVAGESTYAEWALENSAGAADSNDDGGLLDNLQEYAFGGDPTSAADDISFLPVLGEFVDPELGTFDTIEFRQRRFAPDLEYKVQTSTDLQMWTDLWTVDDPDGVMVETVTGEGFLTLTVRQTEVQAAGGERVFFRVLVSLAVDE